MYVRTKEDKVKYKIFYSYIAATKIYQTITEYKYTYGCKLCNAKKIEILTSKNQNH